jgi:hypothetical protein
VSITDAGRALLDRYLPEAVAIQTAMLGGLNDDELQTLSELLTRALRSTDGIDPHAVAEGAAPRRRGRPAEPLGKSSIPIGQTKSGNPTGI